MAIYYKCDSCKCEILYPSTRIAVAVHMVKDDKKTTLHYCRSCYVKYVEPALNGTLLLKEKKEIEDEVMAAITSTKVEEDKEQPITVEEVKSENESVSQEVEDTKQPDSEELLITLASFDSPHIRRSKYFNDETCYDIHRLILIGAKPMAIAKLKRIPYQNVKHYMGKFNSACMELFEPNNPPSKLKELVDRCGKKLSTVRALMATCTWSAKDIAEDVGLEEVDVLIYYQNIPWFEMNFFNKVDYMSEVFK